MDSGYPESLYLVIDGIYRMGFSPRDIRMIVHSHGHYDHIGATRALVELTGARTYLGAEDRDYANGTLDLTWARELDAVYNGAFEPDVLLHDGDKITLGDTEIGCVHTPGHTPGTFSFFFDVTDGSRTLRCGTFGGSGFNSMELSFLARYGLPQTCRTDFLRSVDRLMHEDVDIFIGNHASMNKTPEKYLQMLKTGENLFLNTNGEWKSYLRGLREKMTEKIRLENL